jgi:AAA+ ATPase superfamily predicted ATPase
MNRTQDLEQLKEYCEEPGAGFLCLRGRRRIGKTWLLRSLAEELSRKGCFTYTGNLDESAEESLRNFTAVWVKLSGDKILLDLRSELVTWQRIFESITDYIKKTKKKLVLIFDEIQWIGGTGSGFVGSLKTAWVDWERTGLAKVIICGSSNKFFSKFVGGETKILRGIKTRRDLWIEEFSPTAIRDQLFPKWSKKEVFCLYMMFGGVPYYLNQFDRSLPFIRSLNDGAFINKSIFLEEWQEVLSLDFNSLGLETSSRLLKQLVTGHGVTMAELVQATGFTEDTVRQTVLKLIEYRYLEEHKQFLTDREQRNRIRRGTRYTTNDPYLFFYFTIISKLTKVIEENRNGLIVPRQVFDRPGSLYVPQFSGLAFESAVARIFTKHFKANSKLANKLALKDRLFSVHRNIFVRTGDKSIAQIDLLLVHEEERSVRLFECKWSDTPSTVHIDECLSKPLPYEYRDYQLKRVLVTSYDTNNAFLTYAKEREVTVVGVEEMI